MISVIIPTYNYAQYLPFTLNNVLRQKASGAQVEIIVVDDGSTDRTAEILAGYRRRINVFRQENRGLSAARNRGMQEAEGNYFLFLDSDDLLAEDTLPRQMKFLEKNQNCDVAVCRNELFSRSQDNGAPVACGSWNLFANDLDIHLCHFNIAPPHALLIRRECLQGLKFDSGLRACEDHWFWCQLLAKGAVFRANPSGKAYYRRHPESMSSNVICQLQHDALLHKRIFNLLEQRPAPLTPRLGLRYLACFSGSVWTYQRFFDKCSINFNELKNIADQSLDRALDIGIDKSMLAHWLLIRALSVVQDAKLASVFQSFAVKLKPLLKGISDLDDLTDRATQLQRSMHLA